MALGIAHGLAYSAFKKKSENKKTCRGFLKKSENKKGLKQIGKGSL